MVAAEVDSNLATQAASPFPSYRCEVHGVFHARPRLDKLLTQGTNSGPRSFGTVTLEAARLAQLYPNTSGPSVGKLLLRQLPTTPAI